MKKPSLRFRQVFEHGTHFKVTRPMGNPITIAKSAISPTMQARLRKFAQGGEVRNYQTGGEVAEPSQEMALPEGYVEIPPPAIGGYGPGGEPMLEIPPAPGVVSASAAPVAAAAPAPVAVVAPVAEASPAAPAGKMEYAARKSGSRIRPVREAAASGSPRPFTATGSVGSTQEGAETALAEPVPPAATTAPAVAPSKPTEPAAELTEEQQLAAQLRGETKAAIQAEQQRIAKVQEAETAAADLAADQAKAYQAEVERYQQQVADARKIQKEASDDMAAGRNVGSYFSRLGTWNQIGTALSLAAGAFASGMTGMPNFALQIYNNAMEKDLEKQREDRNSLWTKFVNAGNTAQEADQLVRASMDKALAARAAQQAAVTRNAKAADGFAKFSAELNQKSETTIAKIEQSKAVAAKARAETAVAEAKPAQEAVKLLREEVKRMEDLDRQGRLDKMAQETLNLKRREVKIAEEKAAREARLQQPAAPGATEYDQLQQAFAAEGTKGLAKKVSQTFSVDGVKLLARDETSARDQQKLFNNFRSSKDALDALVKEVDKIGAWDAMAPTERASKVRSLAARFAVSYPKSENFNRALSVADKDVVLEEVLQDPTSLKSWLFNQSKSALKVLQEEMEKEKIVQLKDAAVEGDPNLARFLAPRRGFTLTPASRAGR